MKRKVILVENVIQQTNQYVFVLLRDGIDPQIVYDAPVVYFMAR